MSENKIISKSKQQKFQQWWKWMWLLSPIVFLFLGGLQHFLYDWLPWPIITIWAPVSESVWEHEKLVFYPMLVWWISMFFVFRKEKSINPAKWFSGMIIGIITSMLGIIMLFYTLYDGFGIAEGLAIDILNEFFCLILGQLIGYHIYKFSKLPNYWLYISIGITVALAALIIAFTFAPPSAPVFISAV
jgi:hypothetical protein